MVELGLVGVKYFLLFQIVTWELDSQSLQIRLAHVINENNFVLLIGKEKLTKGQLCLREREIMMVEGNAIETSVTRFCHLSALF